MSVSMHERWRGNLGPRHAICAALEREVATSRFAAEEYGNASLEAQSAALSRGVCHEWRSDSWDTQDRTRVAHERIIESARVSNRLSPEEWMFPDGLAAHRALLDRRIAVAAGGINRPHVPISFAEALTMSDFLHDAQSRYVTERIRQHEQREQELQLRQLQEHAESMYRMLDDKQSTQHLNRLVQHAEFMQQSLSVNQPQHSNPALQEAATRIKELLAAKFAAFSECADLRGRCSTAEQALYEAQTKAKADKAHIEELQARLRASEADFESLRRSSLADVELSRSSSAAQASALRAEREKLLIQVSENVQLVDDLRLTVSDLSSALGARKAENEALKRRIEDVSTQYTGVKDELRRTSEKLQSAETVVVEFKAKFDALRAVLPDLAM